LQAAQSRTRTRRAARKNPEGPPFVGALLRLSWQRVRDHLNAAIRAAGYTDLQEAHFAVFSYPLPNGTRPSDLARQMRMSRQAANYLIGQLETLGYLERKAALGTERRLVYLTKRGRDVTRVIYASSRQLQKQWAREVGPEQFDAFAGMLRRFAAPQTAGEKRS